MKKEREKVDVEIFINVYLIVFAVFCLVYANLFWSVWQTRNHKAQAMRQTAGEVSGSGVVVVADKWTLHIYTGKMVKCERECEEVRVDSTRQARR